MATGNDEEELSIVEVDTLPTAEELAARAKEAEGGDDHDDDDHDDDDGDTRLADEEDDDDEGGKSEDNPNRAKRLKRRQQQKAAREKAQNEIVLLRSETARLRREMEAIRGTSIDTNLSTIETRLAEVQREIISAEAVIAKATDEGNGADVVAAMKWRDEAKEKADALVAAKAEVEASKTAPRPGNPAVVNHASQWMTANPWYDPNGGDENSAVTNAIDKVIAAEGYDPATPAYWAELTKRVKARLGGPARKTKEATVDEPQRRKAPPLGATREHAPPSTRREVYVTPERRKAMEEAGIWDDPVRRNKMLKTYADYDRENPRG